MKMAQPLQARTEAGSFGPIDLPGDALRGAQTERRLRKFPIGQQRMPLDIVYALAQVKHAAAEVNGDLGLPEPARRRSGHRRECERSRGPGCRIRGRRR